MKLFSAFLLVGLASCGRTVLFELGDSGSSDNPSGDDASTGGDGDGFVGGGEAGSAPGDEAGSALGSEGGTDETLDGGEDRVAPGGEGGSAGGGGYVDAGYYYGDGSYFVDGGAYPDVATLPDASGEGGMDGETAGDASSACSALSACCASLTSASQSLCNTLVGLENATNCSTELTQLQGAGDCTGVTILSSDVQVTPNHIVSDGTLLFWTTASTPGLLAMPVGGGPITVLLDAQTVSSAGGSFLAVDEVNVYVLEGDSIIRIPKSGAPPTLVNESGAMVVNATSLGGSAYWVENTGTGLTLFQPVAIKAAPLLGTSVTTIASVTPRVAVMNIIGVTSNTVFVGQAASGLYDFPMSGVPASGPAPVMGGSGCDSLTSDTSAVYCAQDSDSNIAIASDGTITDLGPAVGSSYIVFDDTYAYWADRTTVGTIMKAPKAGGGPATVLARDTSPTAIAVDANSIYWSDQEGYIKSVPK